MGRIVRAFRCSKVWVEEPVEEKEEGDGEKRELSEFEAE